MGKFLYRRYDYQDFSECAACHTIWKREKNGLWRTLTPFREWYWWRIRLGFKEVTITSRCAKCPTPLKGA